MTAVSEMSRVFSQTTEMEIPDLLVFTETEFFPTEKAPNTFFQFLVP